MLAFRSNFTSKPRPVLAFMHASGFYKYSATSKYVGPQYLMDRDLILVTMNYRLGSLGMLAAGTKEHPGNAALKDQVLVLKWIKKNIAHFGGDPNMVTLMGISAGSISATLHMVSPMSKGESFFQCLSKLKKISEVIIYFLNTPYNRDDTNNHFLNKYYKL